MFQLNKVIKGEYKIFFNNKISLVNVINKELTFQPLIDALYKRTQIILFDTLKEQKKFFDLLKKSGKFNPEEILNFYSWNKLYNKNFNPDEFNDKSIYRINKNQNEKLTKSKIILMTIDKFYNNEINSKFENIKIIYIGNKLLNKTNHNLTLIQNSKNKYFKTTNYIYDVLLKEIKKDKSLNSIKILDIHNYDKLMPECLLKLKNELKVILSKDNNNQNNIIELYEVLLDKIKSYEIKDLDINIIKEHYLFFKNLLLTKKVIFNNEKLYTIEFRNINSLSSALLKNNNLLVVSNYYDDNILNSIFKYYSNFEITHILNSFHIGDNYLFFNPKYKNSPVSSYSKQSTFWKDKKEGLNDLKNDLVIPLLNNFKINLITFKDKLEEFSEFQNNPNFKSNNFNSNDINKMSNAEIYIILGNLNLSKYSYEEYVYFTGINYDIIKNWFVLMKNYELLGQLKLEKEHKIILLYGYYVDSFNKKKLRPIIFENYLKYSQLKNLVLKIKSPYDIDTYNLSENRYDVRKKIKKNMNKNPEFVKLNENEFKNKLNYETNKQLDYLSQKYIFDSLNYWHLDINEFDNENSFYYSLKEYLRPYFKQEFCIKKKNFTLNDLEPNEGFVKIRKYNFLKSLSQKQKRR